MLIGPQLTVEQIDAKIAQTNADAKRLPPSSDAHVAKLVEINRLLDLRAEHARRDAMLEQAHNG
jgi:hypothetical protein